MKTIEEVEQLKRGWQRDPCWDIENTEGFEDHKQELLEYRKQCEAVWEEENRKEKRKGGYAFPCYTGNDTAEIGMTLRDYFAGQALMGLCAARAEGKHNFIAEWAYKLADAMITAREL